MIQALKTINWKAFALLLAAGLVGVFAVLPFVFELIEGRTFGDSPAPDIPVPLLVGLTLLQNGVLLAVVILLGMILSARVGLQMPLVSAWTSGGPRPNRNAIVVPGILVGAATGAVLVLLEALFFLRQLPPALVPLFEIPLWKRLLAGVLYGGITEELLMRLFLVSLVAWLLGRIWKTPDVMPAPGAFWAGIVFVAILFGLGHLPITAAITPLTPLLVTRALVLNGVAGVAFGYLYWRYGLEAAMLGHMSAHLVLQAPGVMLLKSMQ
ncbi:MAG: CPBP family intramembrane glutamic endopeptidase [Candidatus Acidiferrales bacterium]